MDLSTTLAEIAALSVDERIRLAEAIWDSIAEEPEQIRLTEAQKAELDKRLAAHATSPSEDVPWEEVNERP